MARTVCKGGKCYIVQGGKKKRKEPVVGSNRWFSMLPGFERENARQQKIMAFKRVNKPLKKGQRHAERRVCLEFKNGRAAGCTKFIYGVPNWATAYDTRKRKEWCGKGGYKINGKGVRYNRGRTCSFFRK